MPIQPPYAVGTKKPFINLLLYAPPGTGKTFFAATAAEHPDMGDVLFINIEGGLLTLGSKKGVQAIDVNHVGEVEEIFWALVNKQAGFEKIKTVVMDSGTELQSKSLAQFSEEAFQKDIKKNGVEKAKRQSIDDLWQDDYGKDTARLKRIFRWFRDAPFHFIVTALSKKNFDKPASRDVQPTLIECCPFFTDKLGIAVQGYMDFVWYMYIDPETQNRKLLTRDKGVFKAKTRGMKFSETIGEVVDSPNLAKLYDTLLKTESAK